MDSKIKIGLSGLKPADLLLKGRLLITNMTGNANFADPVPSLADLTTALDEFETRVELASFGDRRAIRSRNNGQTALVKMLGELGSYVSFIAKGDGEIIESSGFEVRNASDAPTSLGQPIDFSAERSDKNGEIECKWKRVSYGKAYQIEITTTDPAEGASWSVALVTSKSNGTVKNLTAGTSYWFRVMAISGDMTSAYSGVELVMAA